MRIPLIITLVTSGHAAYAQSIEFETGVTALQQADANILLAMPSAETTDALIVLKHEMAATNLLSGVGDNDLQATPGFEASVRMTEETGTNNVAISDQILIKFSPEASAEDIASVISDYDLQLIDVYEGLGAINAQADLSEYFESASSTGERLQASIDASNAFLSDARIVGAIPNMTTLQSQADAAVSVQRSVVPTIENTIEMSEAHEDTDWGMSDIGAAKLWGLDELRQGQRVGVIDVGFALHEDLVFDGLDGPSNDHGNHVAGIICAKHNGKGVRGVVPECQVVPKTGDFLPIVGEDDDVASFMLLFSQILLTMNDFVIDRDEVTAFNASLGYNWASNFNIDPEDPDNASIRAIIQNQAVFMFPALQAAAQRDIPIFSAAGNDNSPGGTRAAKWASPFNWAANTLCEVQGVCSGVVVEAHDEDGTRARFSNIGGDVSCPGVKVLSTIAVPKDGYGTMSGTSMASPYCTGGYVVFSMLRPNYSSREALDCIVASGEAMPHGTPKMDLAAALAHCPVR